MFNEILKGVDEFINMNRAFAESSETISMARYLSLAYDIPANAIAKVTRIKMEKIPDFMLVSIDYDLQNRICDYMIYDGELVKVISFSPKHWYKSDGDKIAIILALLGDINNSIIDSYRSYINPNVIGMSTFTDTLTYAPFIMAMAYIQNYLPFIEDKIIATVFRLMYPKITEESIKSARKLLVQFSVSDLLDRCVWYGVTNKEYPDIRCCELEEPKVKTAVPGKGVWNLSDMEDEEFPEEELEDPEDEFPEEELDYQDEDDYQGMNDEETDKYLKAQEDYEEELEKKQEDNFTVPLDDADPFASAIGRDTRKPISFINFPGGKNNG